jgi:hypothetical protein
MARWTGIVEYWNDGIMDLKPTVPVFQSSNIPIFYIDAITLHLLNTRSLFV